jgi:hypothetical protein
VCKPDLGSRKGLLSKAAEDPDQRQEIMNRQIIRQTFMGELHKPFRFHEERNKGIGGGSEESFAPWNTISYANPSSF